MFATLFPSPPPELPPNFNNEPIVKYITYSPTPEPVKIEKTEPRITPSPDPTVTPSATPTPVPPPKKALQVRSAEKVPTKNTTLHFVSASNVDYCSCVSYAKWKSGINVGSIGYAKNHPINRQAPEVGAIIITSESAPGFYTGHIGVVISFTADSVTITESNYKRCKVTTRTLNRNNPVIRGFYK